MMPPKLILSPIDFSEPSQEALKAAADLAVRLGAEICLVHVVPAIPDLPSSVSILKEGEYESELHREADLHLAEIEQKLAQSGIKTRHVVGTGNEAGMEIVRIAEHINADMIVISTHGMTGWHKLMFGSVADKVVHAASCPVMVLKAQPDAASVASTDHSNSEDTIG